MIRIAYVINSIEGGGAALPVPAVIAVLRDCGADVRLFALARRDGRALPAISAAGVRVEVRDGSLDDHVAALRWLDRAVAGYRPTHIWTSLTRATLLGQLVGWKRRLPVVSWQHAAYLKPANLRLLRATQRLSRLWIGDSQSVAALTATRLGVPAERLTMWPLFAADPAAPQARPWSPGEPLRLGSLGRLHRVKGYDILIEALALLGQQGFSAPVPFTMTIAGEGAERDALTAVAREAAIGNLSLAGFVDRPRDFLAGLHLYLQPSRSEGLCIAAHEAMQAGLGGVVSAVGELPYSVEHGVSGLVVPPGDPKALASALAQFLGDPARTVSTGAAARARVLDRFGAAAFTRAGEVIFSRLEAMVR
jgi:glycosyltransferase involved in cell wall biosynthesis